VPRQWDQSACVRGGVAQAVDQQVRAFSERCGELTGVVPVSGDEPSTGGGDVGRQAGRVAPGQVDLPVGVVVHRSCIRQVSGKSPIRTAALRRWS
jgi:hypothetical protein